MKHAIEKKNPTMTLGKQITPPKDFKFCFLSWSGGGDTVVLGEVEIGHDYLNFIFHFLLGKQFFCSLIVK